MKKGFIFLCGNDGTGKSSLALTLQNLDSSYFVIERSLPGLSKEWRTLVMFLDEATLHYTFDPRPTLPVTLQYQGVDYPIYWIMLDASVEVIQGRILNRPIKTIYETKKCLEYFKERYRELSAYYGLPLIDTGKYSLEGEAKEILRIIESKEYDEIRSVRAEIMSYDFIKENYIEAHIAEKLKDDDVKKFDSGKFVYGDGFMDDEIVKTSNENIEFKRKLIARWLIKYGVFTKSKDAFTYEKDGLLVTLPAKLYFHLFTEGESKKIFQIITNSQYLSPLVIIILKSTIYSHTKQATGEISGLGQIRSKGTIMFLEMAWRNQIHHAYRSVNPNGIIIADFVDTKPVEIVFKKYCEGTDKHSYYGITQNSDIVLETGEYICGTYIRFDWRNPNHISVKTGTNIILNPYYYLLEEHYGKEAFFAKFLKTQDRARPFGDKAVCSDILEQLIDVPQTRETAMKMVCTMQSYLTQLGLEAKDGCFMLDKSGKVFWSEVNQDCLRVQVKVGHESLDKDIWRAGGSAAKDQVVKKWNAFNDLMYEYFKTHKFMESELKNYTVYMYQNEVNRILNDSRLKITPLYNGIYQKLRYQNDTRTVILTLDIFNQKPSLVKSGIISETHSDGDIMKAFKKISIYPDVLVVDLNGALEEGKNNREIIKSLAKSDYIYAGGGIRTLEDVQEILASSARRVAISSNTDPDFLNKIPKDRLLVELSVDEKNNVLIHGRKTNTHIEIIDKITELIKLGVTTISITFNNSEGHLKGLPREQICEIMSRMPDKIEKVIIAGGISSLDDLEFLWSFYRVVPQLGSAIWRGKINLGDLYVSMTRFNGNGLVTAIIQDLHGIVKGLVWLNAEALKKTCETRVLHRYSRQHRKLMCKGDTSGNYHHVKQISLDCDSDALLITVETDNDFCHKGKFSCFNIQSIIKANLNALIKHIKSKKGSSSYSGKMQKHSGLALAKMMEEYWEIVCATNKSQVFECSDFLVHFIMYLNSIDANFDDIINELNSRRWDPRIIQYDSHKKKELENKVVIGITAEKYTQVPDEFTKKELGFEINRPTGRSLKIGHNITDKVKYEKFFGTKDIALIPVRPRDMSMMISIGTLDYVITYDMVLFNNPKVAIPIYEAPAPHIMLCLIKRKNDTIDISKWSSSHKAVIATEAVNDVHDFLVNVKKLQENVFTLVHIAGTSESFIVNDTKTNYILCDAIVETGKTLEENGLEIWETIRKHGEIKTGLYQAIH